MKNLCLAGLCLLSALTGWAADDPIISFSTSIYEEKGPDNSFSIVLGTTGAEATVQVDCGSGPQEYTVQPTSTNADDGSATGTLIDLTAGPSGQVKVYGDPSVIDYFNANGVGMTSLAMAPMPALTILNLEHNALRELDLTPYTSLYSLSLSDNPFSGPASLTVGAGKTDLAILELAQIEKMAPGFQLSDYHSLQVFDGYYNLGLTEVDPAGCPLLLRLSLDCAAHVTKLDVSKNTELLILNIAETGITDIDLSHNDKIQQLYCQHNSASLNTGVKLASIDVSNMPELRYLYAGGNAFTSIDLTHNPRLFDLGLESNRLTSLDIDANPELYYVNIKDNDMDFATLPMPRDSFSEYYYQQRPMPVARSYKEGDKIDFSSRVNRPGTETTGILYMLDHLTGESEPVYDAAYDYNDGLLTLNDALPDSVYMLFTNDAFPAYDLTSACFMVKTAADFGKPSVAAEFTTSLASGQSLSLRVGMLGATAQTPKEFLVDFGDGDPQSFQALTEGLPLAATATGVRSGSGSVKILAPEGQVLTAIGAKAVPMNSFDCTAASNLKELAVSGAGLTNIDLRYNRDLRYIQLDNNQLDSINMKGINGLYEKNALAYLDLSHNRLSALELTNQMCIEHYDISYNQFSDFNYRDFDNCLTANFSHNPFQRLLLGYFVSATDIDASGCNLTEVQLPDGDRLQRLDLSDNDFTLADIPYITSVPDYIYYPQRLLPLPAMAPAVNLSEQNRVIEGVSAGSEFKWTMADGSPIPDGEIDQDGPVVKFTNPDLGLVHCAITNPAFPLLTLRTTDVQTADMPTNVIASFVTVRGGETPELILASSLPADVMFIDWRGDGTGLEMYQVGQSPVTFQGRTFTGALAKAYSYDAQDHITTFTLDGATLKEFDGSGFSSMEYLTVTHASLSTITLPDRAKLKGLGLSGNLFESFDFSGMPNMEMLTMGDNLLTSLTLTDMPRLGTAAFPDNDISELHFSNAAMWALYLERNQLASIDLSQCPGVEQLSLDNNLLRNIDLSPLTRLHALSIAGNYFDFTTLPLPDQNWLLYNYRYQQPLDAVCTEAGRVDLSTQAKVGETSTEYTWYVGMPQRDPETGELVGTTLAPGTDYTIADGVTTFLTDADNVMCVMTNSVFPGLELYTNLLNARSGILGIDADTAAPVEYYNLQGLRLPAAPRSGIYIRRQGTTAVKVIR